MNLKPHFAIVGLAAALGLATPASAQTTTLIGASSVWRYLDDGSDQGTAWSAPGFNDNGWASGLRLFGFETAPVYPEPFLTPWPVGGGRITYYARTYFNWSGSANGIVLSASAFIDDGAVCYLNGVEVGRVRMPGGPVAFNTVAQVVSPEGVADVFSFPASGLVQGVNVLAVEVHQASPVSSDVVFGLTLTAAPDTTPPTLASAIGDCANNKVTVTYSEPVEPLSAIDPFNYAIFGAGPPIAVINALLLPGGQTVCLVLDPSTPLLSGVTYTLAVMAVSDLSGNVIAPNSQLQFACPNNNPPVAICQNVVVPAGAGCSATASIDGGSFDPDGNPITLSQTPAGPYSVGTTPVTLTVTDNQGASSSCAAFVTVVDATPPTLACNVQTGSLWPANGALKDVGLSVTAADACSPPVTKHVSVYSDEPILPVSPDATLSGTTLQLRAQRNGGGDGRVYLIVVTATDAAGNSTFCCKTVVVPKANSPAWVANVNAQAAAALASCTAGGSPLTPHVILP